MKIKNVSKEITYYVKLDEDVDDPEFLWYRMNEKYRTWEFLNGDGCWERCLNNLELNEAFREYYKNPVISKRDIIII